jgi:hypothetical protein
MRSFVYFAIFASLFGTFHCFFEVIFTDGAPTVLNDRNYVNLDKLRVRKYNRSGHYVLGEFETFKEFSNEFMVGGG